MKFNISTKGNNDIINITDKLSGLVEKSGAKEGICLVFVAHSTCAITTIEYEEGVIQDLKRALEILAPMNENYEHCKRRGDCNGYAHVRAGLMNPGLAIPVEDGKLILGKFQQIVLVDFDNRPREREIIVKIIKNNQK